MAPHHTASVPAITPLGGYSNVWGATWRFSFRRRTPAEFGDFLY